MDIHTFDARAYNSTARVLSALSPDQFDLPTPCNRWVIRDIVQHLVDNNRRGLARLDGREPGHSTPVAADPRPEYRESANAFTKAFADPALLDREFPPPFTNGRGLLAIHASDVLVHGWDIAIAAGLDPHLEADLVDQALTTFGRFEHVPDLRGPGRAFAEAVPVPHDADPQTRLLALVGRDATWQPTIAR